MAAALSFVLVFCLNEYVGWNHRMLGSYRAVLGHFEGGPVVHGGVGHGEPGAELSSVPAV